MANVKIITTFIDIINRPAKVRVDQVGWPPALHHPGKRQETGQRRILIWLAEFDVPERVLIVL